jgi:hypothetical protein
MGLIPQQEPGILPSRDPMGSEALLVLPLHKRGEKMNRRIV